MIACLLVMNLMSGSGEEDRIAHFAVIVSGSSGDARHARWFWNSSTWIYRVLKEKYGYEDENIYYLYEEPTRAARQEEDEDKNRKVVIDGKATLGNFRKILEHLEGIVAEGDRLFFFMIGHAGFHNGDSWHDLVGEDLSGAEFGRRLDRLKTKNIVAVFSPCQTEGFILKAGKPGRVILTSTRRNENNCAGVAEAAIRGLEDSKYDLDKDGRLSLYEAYESVVQEQVDWYRSHGLRQSEHALIDDNGDARGSYLPDEPDRGDGETAKGVFLGNNGSALRLAKRASADLARRNGGLRLEP